MAMIPQREQLLLHEFSQRVRGVWADKHPMPGMYLETVQDAVRGEYEKEQSAKRAPSAEPPTPAKEKEREPEEPDRE